MFTNILAAWKNTELIGIFAGIFILISFIPRKEYLIRSINIIGCVLFSIYGFVNFPKGEYAWSIIVINSTLAVMQVVYLSIYFANLKKKKQQNVSNSLECLDNLSQKLTSDELRLELENSKKQILNLLNEKDEKIKSLNSKLTKLS